MVITNEWEVRDRKQGTPFYLSSLILYPSSNPRPLLIPHQPFLAIQPLKCAVYQQAQINLALVNQEGFKRAGSATTF